MTMRLGLLAGCLGAIGLLVQPTSGTLLAQNDPSLALSGQVTSTAEGAMEGVLVTAKERRPSRPPSSPTHEAATSFRARGSNRARTPSGSGRPVTTWRRRRPSRLAPEHPRPPI
jgi:hypothetical protein